MVAFLWIAGGLLLIAWGFIPERLGWDENGWFAANVKARRRNALIASPLMILFGLYGLLVA
jgi:hypothetical protein